MFLAVLHFESKLLSFSLWFESSAINNELHSFISHSHGIHSYLLIEHDMYGDKTSGLISLYYRWTVL